MTTLRTLAAVAASLMLCGLSFADAPAAAPVKFSIEAQPLEDALNQFAKQTGIQVLFQSDMVTKEMAPRVDGELTPEDALKLLLGKSGLKFKFVNERTVSITEGKETVATQGMEVPIRLVQAGAASSASEGERQVALKDEAQGQEGMQLEEIVVTGTHLRGAGTAAGSQVLTIRREDIERSGYATVQDLMNALPQNFGGGVSQDNLSDVTALNLNGGTALNLRGLGTAATLVLINGRRQPAGGLNGTFVDVSSIATSAIERIEILPDGASAIYGSDAVAGVVNFILRKDFRGAETAVRLGTLDGDASDNQFSQLLGTGWSGGSVLFGYQYFERDALARADRTYSANGDYRRFGGSDFRNFMSNPGNILGPDGQPAFAIPTGQDGTALTADDLLPGVTNFDPERGDLLAEQRTHSAFFTLAQDVGERVELFAEGRFAKRDMDRTSDGFATRLPVPSFYPFFVDPFGGSFIVTVAYNFFDDLGPLSTRSTTENYSATAGANLDLGSTWRLSLSGSYSEESADFANANTINNAALFGMLFTPGQDPATAFNPFGDGSNTDPATVEALRASQTNSARSDIVSANATLDGALFDAPGGMARLAFGGDYREESTRSNLFLDFIDFPLGLSDDGRNAKAAFAELSVPFIGDANARPGLRRLNVSVAGRYEDYSDFGSTFDPRVGISWAPSELLTLRGSWGTSFRAPRLIEQDESPTVNSSTGNSPDIAFVEDPQSPTGFSNVLFRVGGNRDLKPEEATTWTFGVDVDLPARDALDVSLTYFDIDYTDRIARGGPSGNRNAILLQEDIWSELIIRDPTPEQFAPFCDNPAFGLDCSIPPAAIADVRLRNLAGLRSRGVDLQVRDSMQTAFGTFGAGLNAAYLFDFEQRVSNTAPELEAADTVGNPLALRLRGELSWSRGALMSTAFINHAGAYRDELVVPARRVDSWTTLDLNVGYRTPIGDGLFESLQVLLSTVNVFDEDPPFVNVALGGHGIGYDTANADLLGRIVGVQIKKEW